MNDVDDAVEGFRLIYVLEGESLPALLSWVFSRNACLREAPKFRSFRFLLLLIIMSFRPLLRNLWFLEAVPSIFWDLRRLEDGKNR